MRVLSIFFVFITTANSAFAMDNFRNIEGLSYYEYLGVQIDDDITVIKKEYFKRIKVAHPDKGGSSETAQKLNEAFDALQHHRAAYNVWLNQTFKAGARFSYPHTRGFEEIRKRVLDRQIAEVDEFLKKAAIRSKTVGIDEMSWIGRMTLVYNQRFLPFASIVAEDLLYLIHEFSLVEPSTSAWSEESRLALAYGAITVLKEGLVDGYQSAANTKALEDVRSKITDIVLKGGRDSARARTADAIHQFLDGFSLMEQLFPRSCEQTLTTKVRYRDANGVEWEIPISISVKIGS